MTNLIPPITLEDLKQLKLLFLKQTEIADSELELIKKRLTDLLEEKNRLENDFSSYLIANETNKNIVSEFFIHFHLPISLFTDNAKFIDASSQLTLQAQAIYLTKANVIYFELRKIYKKCVEKTFKIKHKFEID